MEEFCRSAMRKHGDSVVTDIVRMQTDVKTFFTASPQADGHEFVVGIGVTNASNISFHFLKQDSGQRQIVTSAYLPQREDSVVFDCGGFSSSDEEEKVGKAIMSHVLDNMIMTPSLRRQITNLALHTARALIASRPPKHNCILIDILVGASFKFEWDEMPVLDDEDELRKEVRGYTVPAIDAETCAICLKDFSASDNYDFTPCGHKFHVDCINGWICSGRGLPCPICRHNFDPFASQHPS